MQKEKSKKVCYLCKKPFDEREREEFSVWLDDDLRRCHRSCYNLRIKGKTNIRFKIR